MYDVYSAAEAEEGTADRCAIRLSETRTVNESLGSQEEKIAEGK